MNAERRGRAVVLLLFVVIAASQPGCFVINWARQLGGAAGGTEPPKMSTVEARAALSRARQHLYGPAPPDYNEAIRLAEGVIAGCDSLFSVWEGYAIKAAALQAQGNHKEAAAAARAGVDALLAAQAGPLSEGALTALKRLAVSYAENAAAARDGDPVTTLCAWREALRGRYSAAEPDDQAGLRAVEDIFSTLQELAEESAASRPAESRIRRAVQGYIAAFNRGEIEGILRLVAGDTIFAVQLRRRFAAPETPEAVRALYLLGAVQADLGDDGSTATASCDLLATTAAGWARRVPGVRFFLNRRATGEWQILDVAGHP